MSSTFQNQGEHPSLGLHVTAEQRERAEHWLQQAYADGRITEDEFDQRIGQVISASTRLELNQAFYGLVSNPTPGPIATSAYSPYVPATSQPAGTNGVAGLAHFAALGTSIVGPGVIYALSSRDTPARREAAKSFNFQVVALLSLIATGIISGILPGDWFGDIMFPIVSIGWFILTILGGVKALQGDNWRNPVKSVVKLDLLPEK